MTFVEGRRARTVNYGSFVHITDVPVMVDGIRPGGVEFAGELTAAEADAVWWFLTSTDNEDQARRQELASLREAAAADPSLENVSALAAAVASYQLGDR